MGLLKLKGRIEKAIQSHPYEYDPLNDMFGLCREYEKVDFDIAHAWNHDLRPKIAVALQATVERSDFLAAERFNDLLYRWVYFLYPVVKSTTFRNSRPAR